jgi:hypothetical protein
VAGRSHSEPLGDNGAGFAGRLARGCLTGSPEGASLDAGRAFGGPPWPAGPAADSPWPRSPVVLRSVGEVKSAETEPAAEPDPARDLKTGDADAAGDADQEGTHAGPLEPAVEPSAPGSTSRSG